MFGRNRKTTVTPDDLKSRSNLAIEVFSKTIEELEDINRQTSTAKNERESEIKRLSMEVNDLEVLEKHNNNIINKINKIIAD